MGSPLKAPDLRVSAIPGDAGDRVVAGDDGFFACADVAISSDASTSNGQHLAERRHQVGDLRFEVTPCSISPRHIAISRCANGVKGLSTHEAADNSAGAAFMNTYVEFLLLGLGNGGVFAALAMALVVTYRSSGVLNFATGAQALYAAYTCSLLRNGQLLVPIPGLGPTVTVASSMAFWPAFLITLTIQAVMGALAYLLIFRPLRNHRPVAKAVASIGLMGLLTAIVTYQVGTHVVLVNPIFPQSHVRFLDIDVSTDRLWLAATVIGLGVLLTVLFRCTRFGLTTRASAETEVGALVSGLSPDRIALINWILSFVICGIAGVLIARLVPLVPGTYTLFIVPALAAAVVGRFHSLGWAITAGLGIGALESLSV
jgi:sulfate-transporting ATPase